MELRKQHLSGVLRAKEAAGFLGIGLSTFWRWVKDGRLPQGIHLSARATVWRISVLEAFIEQQAGSRLHPEPQSQAGRGMTQAQGKHTASLGPIFYRTYPAVASDELFTGPFSATASAHTMTAGIGNSRRCVGLPLGVEQCIYACRAG